MRAKVAVFCNHKGGVGKTTATQVQTAYFSGLKGLKVLLVDCDPQGNLSARYLTMVKNAYGEGAVPPPHPDCKTQNEHIASLFKDKPYTSISDVFYLGFTIPYDTKVPSLEIVPVDGHALSEANELGKDRSEREIIDNFTSFIDAARDEDYDVILIDTPPNRGPVTRAAIRAATDAFIIVRPEPKSIEGLSDMVEMIQSENQKKELSEATEIKGILVNGYSYKDRSVHDRTISFLKSDESISPYILECMLGERVDLKLIDMVDAEPTNPFGYPKTSPVYKECLNVASAIEERMKRPGIEINQYQH